MWLPRLVLGALIAAMNMSAVERLVSYAAEAAVNHDLCKQCLVSPHFSCLVCWSSPLVLRFLTRRY